jgi:hypothetical protein
LTEKKGKETAAKMVQIKNKKNVFWRDDVITGPARQ